MHAGSYDWCWQLSSYRGQQVAVIGRQWEKCQALIFFAWLISSLQLWLHRAQKNLPRNASCIKHCASEDFSRNCILLTSLVHSSLKTGLLVNLKKLMVLLIAIKYPAAMWLPPFSPKSAITHTPDTHKCIKILFHSDTIYNRAHTGRILGNVQNVKTISIKLCFLHGF